MELVAYVVKFTDQIDRRILRGETIPPQEKVLSIFKPHTRWIKKGKAGIICELGVPVAMIEDAHQFVLGHEIIWTDKDVAVSLIKSVQAIYPDARSCSLDRGFYSPATFDELDQLLEVNATLNFARKRSRNVSGVQARTQRTFGGGICAEQFRPTRMGCGA